MDTQKTIGEMVALDYRTAAVFKKYNIDFCCQGNRTIEDACEGKAITSTQVLEDLAKVQQQKKSDTPDFDSWPLDLLADYVEKTHHRYVDTAISQLKPYLDKVAKVHGDRHPELLSIREEFYESAGELTAHMKKEELILFPYVRKVVKAKAEGTPTEAPHFGTVENPIQMMMEEHENEGERYRKISKLTNNYTPPADACNTYRVTFALLQEFEEDLHLHIHLENNIIFPKAIAFEKSLK